MEKVMEKVADRLGAEAKELQKEIDLDNWRAKMLKIYQMEPDTTRPRPPVRPVDTLLVRLGKDTVQLAPKDTLLPQKDTLLPAKDTLLPAKKDKFLPIRDLS